jgi:abortive infection bacteriophage resistance protein
MSSSVPRTYQEQLSILKSRGLIVHDDECALHILTHLNYYRLKSYGERYFLSETGRYIPFTTFDDVLRLYQFDHSLRGLLLDACKIVEVSVRSRLAYELAHQYGPLAHSESFHSRYRDKSLKALNSLRMEVERSKREFLYDHKPQTDFSEIPIWMVVELASFGVVSKLLSGIKDPKFRQSVANTYGLDEKVFCSAVYHLSTVRNAAAHHSRIWNRRFAIEFSMPKTKPAGLIDSFNLMPHSGNIYNSLVMLVYLVKKIQPSNELPKRFYEHLYKLDGKLLEFMGVPEDWKLRMIWKQV